MCTSYSPNKDIVTYNEDTLESTSIEETEIQKISLTIAGRPNVGKSTLVNKLLGSEVQEVEDRPGVTVECADFDFEYKGETYRLVDTPGIRRSARIHEASEKASVYQSRQAIKRSDVVVLMIDATSLEGGRLERQDLRLASEVIKCGKGLVIAFNKCDKTPYKLNSVPDFLKRNFDQSLSQLKEVPFLFMSALKEQNIEKLMKTVKNVYDKQKISVKTSKLNDWLSCINKTETLKSGSAKFKLKYITQVGALPPRFIIFVSNKDNMRADHERFIINNLKNTFGLKEVPVKIIFREQKKR